MADQLVVFTNGCFDILHRGHIQALNQIKALFPDCKLVVGINSDMSVRQLKGCDRPIYPSEDREYMLLSLSAVDEVIVFEESTPICAIRTLQPDIVIKGEDYYKKDVVGFKEANIGIFLMKHVFGYSTTKTIEQIKELITNKNH